MGLLAKGSLNQTHAPLGSWRERWYQCSLSPAGYLIGSDGLRSGQLEHILTGNFLVIS